MGSDVVPHCDTRVYTRVLGEDGQGLRVGTAVIVCVCHVPAQGFSETEAMYTHTIGLFIYSSLNPSYSHCIVTELLDNPIGKQKVSKGSAIGIYLYVCYCFTS